MNNIINLVIALLVGMVLGLGCGLTLAVDSHAKGTMLLHAASEARTKAYAVQVHTNLQPMVRQRVQDALYLSKVWGTPASKVAPEVYASIERQLIERANHWRVDARTWDGKGFGIEYPLDVEEGVVTGAYIASGKSY